MYSFFYHLRLYLKGPRKEKISPKVPLNCHSNVYFQKETTIILYIVYDKYAPYSLP